MTDEKNKDTFVITRVFDAPRELVWDCFTQVAHMKKWWGPKGVRIAKAEMDLRVGGTYLYGMQAPEGDPMWGKFVYREIAPPEKLVFINSFSDEKGGLSRHPLAPDWPLQLISVFTFEALPGGRTRFTVQWQPYEPTPKELATFEAGHDSMKNGWGGTLDKLAEYLAGLQQQQQQ